MIIAGTGHRPDKCGGYSDDASLRLTAFARTVLQRIRPDEVISGMALGWDQALAQAATELEIPWVAYAPFPGQEKAWPATSQRKYFSLLEKASHVGYITGGPYAAWKMQARNQKMVDNCDYVLALWNGTPGGTANTVDYARSRDKKVVNVWEEWLAYDR